MISLLLLGLCTCKVKPNPEIIKGSYIVMLKPQEDYHALDRHLDIVKGMFKGDSKADDDSDNDGDFSNSDNEVKESSINHIYFADGLHGYSAQLSNEQVDKIKKLGEVDFIETDSVVSIDKAFNPFDDEDDV